MTKEKPKKDDERIDYDYPWWMKTLAGIGGVAVVGIIVTLFFSFGRRPSDIAIPYNPPVESPDFMLGLAGVAGGPLRAGGTARLLNNGDAFFPALREALSAREAEHQLLGLHLGGRARPATTCSAVLDRAGKGRRRRCASCSTRWRSTSAPEDDFERLKAAGGKVEVFRAARLGKLTRFHKRNHRRAIVIDGSVAFTGGMAVGDKWLGNAGNEKEWRDSMVQVTGPLAATVQSAFVDNWAHVGGEILVGPAFFPEFPAPVAAPGETHRPAHRARQLALQREPSHAADLPADVLRRAPEALHQQLVLRARRDDPRRRWPSARSRGWTSASCSPTKRRTPCPSGRPATGTSRSCWRRG